MVLTLSKITDMGILNKARSLRKNQTDVEQLLWKQLRNRNVFNYKFRRQYPIEPYIVDFICFDLKLIIELDGGQHANQADYDQQRSLFLENRGFKVIRFWNNEVTENSDGVLEVIRRLIEGIEYGLNTDHPDGCLNGDK